MERIGKSREDNEMKIWEKSEVSAEIEALQGVTVTFSCKLNDAPVSENMFEVSRGKFGSTLEDSKIFIPPAALEQARKKAANVIKEERDAANG